MKAARGRGLYVDVLAGAVVRAEITLRRGVDLDGVVVDPKEQPVAGAEVWLDTQMTRGYSMMAVTRTDAEGRFRIDDVDPHATVSARAPGRAPSGCGRLLVEAGKRESVRLVLDVTDDDGMFAGRDTCARSGSRGSRPRRPRASTWRSGRRARSCCSRPGGSSR